MSETDKTAAPDGPKTHSPLEMWMTRTTAILAILAALSSGRWGASNLWAILEQGKVNDAWGYYQAKSIKQHMATNSRKLAEALGGKQDLIDGFRSEEKRLEDEKKGLEQHAHDLVFKRDIRVTQSFVFEIAFILIELGVVLCTIASAVNGRKLWMVAIVLGVLGTGACVYGYFFVNDKTDNFITRGIAKSIGGE